MVRPTAANLTVPLSRAKDLTPLASILHVLGTRSRLETLQILMDGPRLSADLPARTDELHMLEGIGVVTSERLGEGRVTFRWELVPEALERISRCVGRSDVSAAIRPSATIVALTSPGAERSTRLTQ